MLLPLLHKAPTRCHPGAVARGEPSGSCPRASAASSAPPLPFWHQLLWRAQLNRVAVLVPHGLAAHATTAHVFTHYDVRHVLGSLGSQQTG